MAENATRTQQPVIPRKKCAPTSSRLMRFGLQRYVVWPKAPTASREQQYWYALLTGSDMLDAGTVSRWQTQPERQRILSRRVCQDSLLRLIWGAVWIQLEVDRVSLPATCDKISKYYLKAPFFKTRLDAT